MLHRVNKNQNGYGLVLIIAAIALVVVIAGWAIYSKNKHTAITNYQECIAAKDALILETYPEQCVVNGQKFTNTSQSLIKTR